VPAKRWPVVTRTMIQKNRQAESLDADFCLLLQPLAAKPGLCTSGIKI